ncbi:transmembrane channel-like protein 8 [Emydura macquarii macquarii]|uniref:transmembrane channel-like protein 8 n=1 Tax=Emydura macquarii macquarii TaxID=1129001 RepID=UPI003529DAD1
MASGVVERLVLSQEYSSRRRARIFAEWDFCIRSVAAASIKQQSICNSLKIDLAEKMRCLKNRQQSTRQRALLYLLRLLINSSILLLLAGAFYCIQQVTELSLDAEQKRTSPSMVLRYLPPVIIFLINVLLPYAFQALVKLEGWSPNTEINLTLIRCVMLKMASLGMFLFSLGQRILCVWDRGEHMCQPCGYNKLYQCWETAIGQEMYKLTIFSFLTTIGVTFLISLPRRLIAEHASGRLAQWVRKDEFLVPQNVLDIVAAQTVIWLGIFYSPLLPLLNTIFIFITFYIKKYTLYRDCRPSQRLFRASSSTFLFQLVLLLGLTMASASLGYVITRVPSSRACGLFANYTAAWKVVPEAVSTRLPPAAQRVLHYVASDAFCFPLLILLCLILTGIVSQTQANRRAIERLKKQQVLHVKEKWCLVRELATLLLEPRQPPVARSQVVLLSATETSRAQGMQETET